MALLKRHRCRGADFLLLLGDAAGHAALLAGARDGFGDRRGDALVEDGGDDVVLRKFFLGNHTGYRVGGGELHLFVDLMRPHVEGTPEDSREAQDVVNLVRVIAAPRGDDPSVPVGLLGHDLRLRVGHREDDRVLRHRVEVIYCEHARHREPQEQVRPSNGLGEAPGTPLRVGVLGEPLLGDIQTFTALVDDTPRVATYDVPAAGLHYDLGARHPRRPDAVHDYLQVFYPLANYLEGIDQGRERHHRRAVLVVVEHGDLELPLQAFLDLEASRGRYVLQVDPAEGRGDVLDGLHDLVGILGIQADGERVHVGELLEEHRLPLHNRHRRPRPDVAEPQNGRTVRDDRHRVPLDREVEGAFGVFGDGAADPRYARRVRHREVVAGAYFHLRAHFDLAAEVHQERPVGDVDDAGLGHRVHGVDDAVPVVRVPGVYGDVAGAALLPHPHDVHGADQPPGPADRRQDPAQSPRPVRKLHPQRHAVARARYSLHRRPFPKLVVPLSAHSIPASRFVKRIVADGNVSAAYGRMPSR